MIYFETIELYDNFNNSALDDDNIVIKNFLFSILTKYIKIYIYKLILNINYLKI